MPSTDGGDFETSFEVSCYQSGKFSFSTELAMPFLEEAVGVLVKDGGTETDRYPITFEAIGAKGPIALFGFDDAIVGIMIFLHTPMGQWAVDRICDALWDKGLRPAVRRLFKRREKESGFGARPLTLCVGAWFDVDTVFVQVIVSLKQGEDAKKAQKLIPQAFQLAYDWIESHGITHPVLVYRIRDGKLSTHPTLAETVPRV
jgi:hypothetical protein